MSGVHGSNIANIQCNESLIKPFVLHVIEMACSDMTVYTV